MRATCRACSICRCRRDAGDLAGDDCDCHWLRFFFFGCVEVFADLADGCNVCKPIRDGLNALLGCLKDDRRSLSDRLCDRFSGLA
jgi:hypothetical protein